VHGNGPEASFEGNEQEGYQGDNNDVKPITVAPFDEHDSNLQTEHQEQQSSSDLDQEGDENSQNWSAFTEESDIERAKALKGRIDSRINLMWGATPGDTATSPLNITVSFQPPLASWLVKNQNSIQRLMSKLQEEAGLFLEMEVPLDLFDTVPVVAPVDDGQVDRTE